MRKLLPTLALTLTLGTQIASADPYIGAALDYGRPHSGEARTHATAILGFRSYTPQFFWGAEVDFGLSVDKNASYNTARARAIFGREMGGFKPIIGAGLSKYMDGGTTYDSANISLGGEYDITDEMSLRGEAIRDFMPDFSTSVTVIRFGVIKEF